jgi:hypothetical protein
MDPTTHGPLLDAECVEADCPECGHTGPHVIEDADGECLIARCTGTHGCGAVFSTPHPLAGAPANSAAGNVRDLGDFTRYAGEVV